MLQLSFFWFGSIKIVKHNYVYLVLIDRGMYFHSSLKIHLTCFTHCRENFEDTWNAQKSFFSSSPQFLYYSTHKPSTFKESMIAPIRGKAGLGHPLKQYHNNSPKCINNVIKRKSKGNEAFLMNFVAK